MKIKHFLKRVEHTRIHQAIQAAELGTAGRVVVYIGHQPVEDGLAAAHETFRQLKLETPRENTGLLIFLAPQSRKFGIVGGTALHEKLGQPWWDHLTRIITHEFRQERYTEGLLAALTEIGQALHTHFPGTIQRQGPEIIEG